MSASAVFICSNALLLLGDSPIADFSENNDRTRLVANLYEQKRDAVLRAHPWNCAIKRVMLAPDTDAPAFGYAHQFSLPSDCLRVLQVGEDGDTDDFSVEGRKLLCDTQTCRLRYLFRNEDESTWDASLVEAMTRIMVAALAYPITKSTSKQELDETIIREVLKSARAVDGLESSGDTLGDFPLLANRLR